MKQVQESLKRRTIKLAGIGERPGGSVEFSFSAPENKEEAASLLTDDVDSDGAVVKSKDAKFIEAITRFARREAKLAASGSLASDDLPWVKIARQAVSMHQDMDSQLGIERTDEEIGAAVLEMDGVREGLQSEGIVIGQVSSEVEEIDESDE